MKITLIYPPCVFAYKDYVVYSHCLGLRSLSSFLKKEAEHEVTFIDALMLGFDNIRPYANGFIAGLSMDEIVARVPPDTELIGLSVPFSLLAPIAHDIVDHIKARFPNVLAIMGGVYPSTQPQLALTSRADFILVGEGESALREIADGRNSMEVQGVYARDSQGSKSFLPARMIDDLDTIPFPDYSIPQMERYFTLSPRNFAGRTASLFTSRGCPFDCEFCSIHPVYGRKWRMRSAENVFSEIQYLVDRHAVSSLEFEDDNFTLERNRTAKILEGIIHLNEKGANIGWRTPNGVRIDTLDEEIIKLIRKSNCTAITVAMEHGDREMLNIMNKELSLEKAFRVMELLIKHEISNIILFLIVGYPGETQKCFQNSLKYLKKIRSLGGRTSVIVNIAQAYPGTRLLARCRAEGYIKNDDFDNFLERRNMTSSRHFVSLTTPDFDAQEVLRRKSVLEECFSSR